MATIMGRPPYMATIMGRAAIYGDHVGLDFLGG